MTTRFSVIIPVYNRPDELEELMESLSVLKSRKSGNNSAAGNFEVIVVEDGSKEKSDRVCSKYSDVLEVQYLYRENAGPAAARNTGAASAKGDWLIFFDSDCVIPEHYFETVEQVLSSQEADFFGGPDRAAASFSPVQKAIDYTMTSFLTTGGIRGGKKQLDRYYPRSFNMGVKKAAFDKTGGFSELRFGEDLDLSMRLMENGCHSVLIEDAWVYHKRRTDLKKFFKQVYNSGMARVVLNRLHPGTMKALHLLPSLFVLYLIFAVVSLPFAGGPFFYPVLILLLILFIDAMRWTGSLAAALLAPAAGVVQLTGYGIGLIHAAVLIHVLGRKQAKAFESTFYK
ncbi:glycosyltransferase [Natronogracilivirga saccharolytica]|uniref:Glycosyltransferase n=1 Tax=Natronogracilivirga saccharolytica TaxID=2812953 RepID=A0A8J7RSN1_9BACT|nr:glycosyltransferase [Natronogracilivirga saccharolytica]MBP3192207.1 glycosyltransferase [Natronogracilivirga saccharolytica]